MTSERIHTEMRPVREAGVNEYNRSKKGEPPMQKWNEIFLYSDDRPPLEGAFLWSEPVQS